MSDPRSEINFIRSNGERLQLLPTSNGATDATGVAQHPFGFECILTEDAFTPNGLDRIMADYEGFPIGDQGASVESANRPANCFPADSVFWSDVSVHAS